MNITTETPASQTLTVRDALELAGYPVPDTAKYYYKLSATKFMVFSTPDVEFVRYTQKGWLFGPGVGVMDEIWFRDSWYRVLCTQLKDLSDKYEGSWQIPTEATKNLQSLETNKEKESCS